MLKPHTGTLGLQPEMTKRVNAFMAHCKTAEVDVMITETWRTRRRQLWLWAKGRILPLTTEKAYLGRDDPEIYSKPRERKVTWTLKSKHVEGLAIDICFKVHNGITYTGDWDKVYDIAESVGLLSLYRKYGMDKPHLEFNPNWKPLDATKKYQIKELEKEYQENAERVNFFLKRLNETTKELSEAKGIKYTGHRITRGQ